MKKTVVKGVTYVVILVILTGLIFSACSNTSAKVNEQLKLGNKYLQEGRYDEAVLAFQKAIEIEPRSTGAYVGLGLTYSTWGKYDKAFEVIDGALTKSLDNPELLCEAKVGIYIAQGNKDGAKAYIQSISDQKLLDHLKKKFPELVDNAASTNKAESDAQKDKTASTISSIRASAVPAIDGALDASWSKPQIVKTLSYSNSQGNVTHPMKAYFLHDDKYLYIAVSVENKVFNSSESRMDVMEIYFDNNNNKTIEPGETILNFWGLDFGVWKYKGNGSWGDNMDNPGGASGVAAHSAQSGSGNYLYEYKVPLNLFSGNAVGIKLSFREMVMQSGSRFDWDGEDGWPVIGSRFDGSTFGTLSLSN